METARHEEELWFNMLSCIYLWDRTSAFRKQDAELNTHNRYTLQSDVHIFNTTYAPKNTPDHAVNTMQDAWF
jgi:hypothetical protein